MNTEKKQEPTNSDIMTKLVNIEKEIEKSEKRINKHITWAICAIVVGFTLGFWFAF